MSLGDLLQDLNELGGLAELAVEASPSSYTRETMLERTRARQTRIADALKLGERALETLRDGRGCTSGECGICPRCRLLAEVVS